MAVSIVPRKATGSVLGVVGMASYIAAGIQDVASGWLIDWYAVVDAPVDEVSVAAAAKARVGKEE